MLKTSIFVGLLSVSLASCAAPLVTLDRVSAQYKVEHANDWEHLAQRTIGEYAETVKGEKPPVFVAPGPADMPFSDAYRRYAEQELYKRGFPVVQSASSAVVLTYQVQTFYYAGNKQQRAYESGTVLGAVGVIGTQVADISSVDTGAAAAFGAGIAYDIVKSMNDRTQAEVILTLRIEGDSKLYFTSIESFYVQQQDLPFYSTNVADQSPQRLSAQAAMQEVRIPVVAGFR